MNKEKMTFKLSDGRVLAYAEFGDAYGKPVFYLHGGGAGSRFFAQTLEVVALRNNIRLISPDRPGIGLSEFQPNRTLLDWAKDIHELADFLKFPTFSIISESGGSAYALACAKQIPEYVHSVAIISGICPPNAPLVKRDLTFQNRVMLSLFKWAPSWLLKLSLTQLKNGIRQNPERFFSTSAKRVSKAERDILLDPDYQKIFIKSVLTAFEQGVEGPLKDLRLIFDDWGFAINTISSNIYIWHGIKDKNAPIAMARYLESTLPNCHATYLADEGHISVLRHHSQEILNSLLLIESSVSN